MVYLEYEEYKLKYLETQKIFNSILMEQEELFTKTQPDAIKYDKDRVQSSPSNSQFDNYLIQKEKLRIDERLKEVKALIEERKFILKKKEEELRQSHDKFDIIYTWKYIDRMRVERIAKKMHYSVPQIYRYIRDIECAIKDDKKC